jgi:NAD(P)-dependent dehydrogenase (short-subunit alcohol dehydrogenase family)
LSIDLAFRQWNGRAAGNAGRRAYSPSIERRNAMDRNPNDRADLAGLRIAITGGTSGLGRELVREWHARGASVAFVARTARDVEHVAAEHSGSAGIVGDIARKDDIHPIALQVLGRLGGLDVLVNGASSLGPVPLAPLADTDCEALEAAIAANLVGPFRLTKALLGALRASAAEGRGAVVLNVSSDAAIAPYAGWGAYGASKAGLHHLSAIWSAELEGEGVTVLSLDPGDMDTPLHRLALPDSDPADLKAPAQSAGELTRAILAELRELARLRRLPAVQPS